MLSAAVLSMSYLESNLTNALENPWYLTDSSKRSLKSFGYVFKIFDYEKLTHAEVDY